MRRLLHRTFHATAGLSLLLFATILVLKVRSDRHADSLTLPLRGNRYTATSAACGLFLIGPPPPATDPAIRKSAAEVVAALSNDQLNWAGYRDTGGPSLTLDVELRGPFPDTPAARADRSFARADLARPLLAALDDPRRFTVAHALLLDQTFHSRWLPSHAIPGHDLGPRDAPGFVPHHGSPPPCSIVDLGGLTVALNRWRHPEPYVYGGRVSIDAWTHDLSADADSNQIPVIRDFWHRQLDVPLGRVSHSTAAAAAAALPLLSLASALRRRQVQRHRHLSKACLACGYSLTGNLSGTCPECGTKVETQT